MIPATNPLRLPAIIPMQDEAGSTGPTVESICPFVDLVIVVNGGSRDGTVTEARAVGALVIVEKARGYGCARLSGAAAAFVIAGLVGFAIRVRCTDMSAFYALSLDTLERLGMREMGYGWNLEVQIRAACAGLHTLDLPFAYRCRIAGCSKVSGNLKGTLRATMRRLRTLVAVTVETRPRRGRGAA